MKYKLTKSVEISGKEYEIRTNYDVILTIIEALNDVKLTSEEKMVVALSLFYVDFLHIPNEDLKEAVEKMIKYIDCGDSGDGAKRPKLMDWEQDFPIIVGAVNRVLGFDVRDAENLSWETFVSAYYEIGDCLFANIVRIRSLKAKGKTLDKADREFYRENRRIVDLKRTLTEEENNTINAWLGKNVNKNP